MKYHHVSVLLREVLDLLDVQKDKWYIDATLGGGGYTKAIIERGGHVLGIDQDSDAISYVSSIFTKEGIAKDRYIVHKGNFSNLKSIATEYGLHTVSGVVYDVGVSSYHIENSKRGFSFLRDETLDMRMDKQGSLTAYEVVNSYSKDELTLLFQKYGEEHKAAEVAAEIVKNRREKKIETTGELVKIIERCIPSRGKIHPATRIFQAIRIEVNDEIGSLRKGLEEGFNLIEKGNGKLVVVSFHSLEDRVVKLYFNDLLVKGLAKEITSRPSTASDQELLRNIRARSARLRGIIRI